MNTYLFIQGFLLGMAAMLAICVFPRVMADIKEQKDGEPEERVYCKDCRYCDVIIDDEKDWVARCRLIPPKNADWPTRYIEDWCGEGVRKAK